MFPFGFFTVLSSSKESHRLILELPEFFHEKLEIPIIQPIVAQMSVIISQGNKAIFGMHFGFMNASNRPLTSVIESALETLPAGQLKRNELSATFFVRERDATVSGEANVSGVGASHICSESQGPRRV